MNNTTTGLCCLAVGTLLLGGCSAFTSTTDTAADIAQTVTHGLSVSSRSTTNSSDSDADSVRYARAKVFVHSQLAQLKREAAAGGGENIDALADLLGRDDGQRMGRWMQQHYADLFAAPARPATVLARIDARFG